MNIRVYLFRWKTCFVLMNSRKGRLQQVFVCNGQIGPCLDYKREGRRYENN